MTSEILSLYTSNSKQPNNRHTQKTSVIPRSLSDIRNLLTSRPNSKHPNNRHTQKTSVIARSLSDIRNLLTSRPNSKQPNKRHTQKKTFVIPRSLSDIRNLLTTDSKPFTSKQRTQSHFPLLPLYSIQLSKRIHLPYPLDL